MKNKIRLSIVGTGYFSQFHFEAWKRLDVEVVGICSLNKKEALEKSKQFKNCKIFSDFKTMINDTKTNLVDIITPPQNHLNFIKIAAESNVNIICQKPFTNSFKEAKKAIKIAKIARVLKQNSVDCMLNFKQINLTEHDIATKLNIILSNLNTIHYQIGDKKHSLFCDFYQDCKYNCINNSNWKNPIVNNDIDYSTFNYTYLDNNSYIIIDKIKHYFSHNNIVINFKC